MLHVLYPTLFGTYVVLFKSYTKCEFHHFSKLTLHVSNWCLSNNLLSFKFWANLTQKCWWKTIIVQALCVVYNPGKKGWDSLSDLVQKVSPFPPMQCWSESCCQRLRQVGKHWLTGSGEGYDKWGVRWLLFFKTIHYLKCPYNREHWDNCNKVGQVSQLFFPGLSKILNFSSEIDFLS